MLAKWLILALVLFRGVCSLVLNLVNYRSAGNPTPENVKDVYDAQTYETWKKYHAEHCRLEMIAEGISCVLVLILLATNLYAAFAALFPAGIFWQLFAVILLETGVGSVVEIAKNYVSTMRIEQKYGFNRSTVKTFVADCIRGTLLNLALSIGLSYLMYLFYSWMGAWMILWFAVAMLCITLLISFLYPFFSRIGNKFTPLEDGELKDNLLALLNKHGYRVKAIEVMDASRRTTKLNAYFTGFGKMKTIVLFDNLLEAMSTEEICAIFAHELGHGLHKDVLKMQILNAGYLLTMAAAVWITLELPALYTPFGFAEVNYGFAYLLVGIILGALMPLRDLAINAHSRIAEYRADRQAVEEGYGEAMITAFKKLAKDNFVHLAPARISVLMEYSHPPISNRVEAVERAIATKKAAENTADER